MRWLYQPLLMLIARSADSEMARHVEFLNAQNRMLRRRVKYVRLDESEKRLLVRLGQALDWRALRALLSVVGHKTYRNHVKALGPAATGPGSGRPQRKRGRRPTPQAVKDLVLRLARENDWGYTRILGELKKLGVKTSRSNVVNILRRDGLDPRTDPGKGTWADFLRAHAQGLWQCDFFSRHIVTPEGARRCFVLAFIHVSTRRVWLSPCTFRQDTPWMADQASALLAHAKAEGLEVGVVLRDRDSAYTAVRRGAGERGRGSEGAELPLAQHQRVRRAVHPGGAAGVPGQVHRFRAGAHGLRARRVPAVLPRVAAPPGQGERPTRRPRRPSAGNRRGRVQGAAGRRAQALLPDSGVEATRVLSLPRRCPCRTADASRSGLASDAASPRRGLPRPSKYSRRAEDDRGPQPQHPLPGALVICTSRRATGAQDDKTVPKGVTLCIVELI
jgi:hypothetical protein